MYRMLLYENIEKEEIIKEEIVDVLYTPYQKFKNFFKDFITNIIRLLKSKKVSVIKKGVLTFGICLQILSILSTLLNPFSFSIFYAFIIFTILYLIVKRGKNLYLNDNNNDNDDEKSEVKVNESIIKEFTIDEDNFTITLEPGEYFIYNSSTIEKEEFFLKKIFEKFKKFFVNIFEKIKNNFSDLKNKKIALLITCLVIGTLFFIYIYKSNNYSIKILYDKVVSFVNKHKKYLIGIIGVIFISTVIYYVYKKNKLFKKSRDIVLNMFEYNN